jgi:hypothetical protein
MILIKHKALNADAASEFNRLRKANENEDLEATMKRMIKMFDGGMVDDVLREHEIMKQLSSETALAFYARYTKVVEKLDAYGFPVDRESNLRRFTLKLRAWKRVREHDCATLEDATRMAGLLEEKPTEEEKVSQPNHDEVALNVRAGRKQRNCYEWENIGQCQYGKKCRYSHKPQRKGMNKKRKQRQQSDEDGHEKQVRSEWSADSDDDSDADTEQNPSKRHKRGTVVF